MADTPITDKGNMEALLKIGAQMADVMFNLAQHPGEPLTGDTVAIMDSLRKQWDAARRTPAPAPELPEPVARVERIISTSGLAEVSVFLESALKVGTELYAAPLSTEPQAGAVLTALKHIHDTFKRDIKQGFTTRDKEFAVEIAAMALPTPAQQPENGERDA